MLMWGEQDLWAIQFSPFNLLSQRRVVVIGGGFWENKMSSCVRRRGRCTVTPHRLKIIIQKIDGRALLGRRKGNTQ